MTHMKKILRSLQGLGQKDFLVGEGGVGCPNSVAGGVEVDTCLGCPRLVSHWVDEENRTWVRCSPTGSAWRAESHAY